jgi:CDP-diacylglycerol--serine O-phosphatidyltransferase
MATPTTPTPPERPSTSPEASRRRRFPFFRRRRPRDGGGRRLRDRFELKKALFILPNAFTVTSIFCGFLAIMLASRAGLDGDDAAALSTGFFERLLSARGPEAFDRAGICLFFAAFFDAFDGRIARLTKTQSDFGVQMDSLADVISFGVAPAIVVYNWALAPLGLPGLLASFGFCACGAIRLARFNVLAARGGGGSSKYFIGLPIPGASSMLISVVMAQSWALASSVEQHTSVLVLVIILSYLMVSRIRFRTFKDFRPRMRTAPLLLALVAAIVLGIAILKARLALVFLVGAYVALGLVEEIVFFKKRRAAESAARVSMSTSPPPPTAPMPTTPTAPTT